MAKFATFKDMFKWNKNLMEDDFNEGQLYTVKHKAKLGSFGDLETNAKVGEADKGSHKLSTDHKASGDVSDFGGVKWEFKGKHDGSVEYKEEFRFLQSTEGLENVIIHHDGTIDGKNGYTPKIGVTWTNDQFKTKQMISGTKVPVFESENSWAPCSHFQLGEKMVCDRAKKDYKFELALAGHFDKTMQYGSLVKFQHKDNKFGGYHCTLYFNQQSGPNTAGATVAYDFASKKYASQLGLKFDKGDHVWKFRFDDQGGANAMLQWQLHQAVKATLTSKMNLKDVPAGKVNNIPLGLNFEVKY